MPNDKTQEAPSEAPIVPEAPEAPVASEAPATPEVEIVIRRHEQLFTLLQNPNNMWRVLLSLFLIIVVIFAGIAFVVLLVKKYYPYNIVETNIQGASTMKNEDKEVSYWLFNTADLWANSGIEVEEGDELTIRASGASYTAIHHLVDASRTNSIPNDRWVGTEGQRRYSVRDELRGKYRINRNYDEGILLMQIIPKNDANTGDDWLSNAGKPYLRDGKYTEVIGRERNHLRVSKAGILHFAVNDIVLTDSVCREMYREYIETLKDFADSLDDIKRERFRQLLDEALPPKKRERFERAADEVADSMTQNYCKKKNQELFRFLGEDSTRFVKYAKEHGHSLGYAPDDTLHYPLFNELVYYREQKFIDPWFVDNLGSFLIVIERKR